MSKKITIPWSNKVKLENFAKEFNGGGGIFTITVCYGRATGIRARIINDRVVEYHEDFEPMFEPEDDF